MKTLFKVLPIVFLSTLASHTAQAEIDVLDRHESEDITVYCIGGYVFVQNSEEIFIQINQTTKLRAIPHPLKCKDYKK